MRRRIALPQDFVRKPRQTSALFRASFRSAYASLRRFGARHDIIRISIHTCDVFHSEKSAMVGVNDPGYNKSPYNFF
jgi:hypothetical protein